MPGFLPITDLGRGVFPGMVSDVLYHYMFRVGFHFATSEVK